MGGPLAVATARRSAGIFRRRWGEGVIVTASASAVSAVLAVPGCMLLGGGIAGGGPVGVTIAVMGAALLLAGIAVSGALDALFRLALYRHEVQGAPSLGLAPEHLDAFLRVKPRRRGLRRGKD